jgi:hypothetical protein
LERIQEGSPAKDMVRRSSSSPSACATTHQDKCRQTGNQDDRSRNMSTNHTICRHIQEQRRQIENNAETRTKTGCPNVYMVRMRETGKGPTLSNAQVFTMATAFLCSCASSLFCSAVFFFLDLTAFGVRRPRSNAQMWRLKIPVIICIMSARMSQTMSQNG